MVVVVGVGILLLEVMVVLAVVGLLLQMAVMGLQARGIMEEECHREVQHGEVAAAAAQAL